jgi:hypothetical protein
MFLCFSSLLIFAFSLALTNGLPLQPIPCSALSLGKIDVARVDRCDSGAPLSTLQLSKLKFLGARVEFAIVASR